MAYLYDGMLYNSFLSFSTSDTLGQNILFFLLFFEHALSNPVKGFCSCSLWTNVLSHFLEVSTHMSTFPDYPAWCSNHPWPGTFYPPPYLGCYNKIPYTGTIYWCLIIKRSLFLSFWSLGSPRWKASRFGVLWESISGSQMTIFNPCPHLTQEEGELSGVSLIRAFISCMWALPSWPFKGPTFKYHHTGD